MFEELRTFVAVAEEGSFTKAAKKLSFSQPAVSQQVKRMEVFFNGATLLTRASLGGNVDLTKEGELVYKRCKEILALVDATMSEVTPHRETELTRLRVGASRTVGDHLLPIILREFAKVQPAVVLSVTIGNTQQVCEMLHTGEVDIGLIEGKNMYHSFQRADFFTDHLILVAAPSLAKRVEGFHPSQLGALPWITREVGSGTRQYQRDFLMANQIKVASQIECNSNVANRELALQGLGVTLISLFTVADALASGQLVRLPMEKDWSRQFSYITKEGAEGDHILAQFIHILQEVGKQSGEELVV